MVGTGQDGVDAGPHFLRVISIDLRLVTNSDVGHPFVLLLLSSLFRLADQREGEKRLFLNGLFLHKVHCTTLMPFAKIGAKVERKLTNFRDRSASNEISNRLAFLYCMVAEIGNGGLIVFKWVEQSLKKQRTINGDVLL